MSLKKSEFTSKNCDISRFCFFGIDEFNFIQHFNLTSKCYAYA